MSTKAQQTLVRAFNELVLERRYEDIHIADIIKRADVSRSTFYQHFHNKEEILRNNLRAVFIPIAEACVGTGSQQALTQVLDHFADVRSLAVAYFASPLSQVMVDLLGQLINERLPSAGSGASASIPDSLVSLQVAESTLGLVKGWLRHPEFKVDSSAIADQIMTSSNAVLGAGCKE
ncbi:MAG: TetR/AcrR family transcriptional regulator [Planctomycetota bacterium]